MRQLGIKNKQGQAVVEMAIFASIILIVLGVLIAYFQQLNDQQYIKMESFRRALQKANTYQGKESESPGASVQLFQVQNSRHADITGEFGKGTTQTQSAEADVFWAVPTETVAPKDLVVARINDDEQETGGFPNEFYIDSQSWLNFNEGYTKLESPAGMVNQRASWRRETLQTVIPGMSVSQYSYRDPQGHYRYYSDVPEGARTTERQMRWATGN